MCSGHFFCCIFNVQTKRSKSNQDSLVYEAEISALGLLQSFSYSQSLLCTELIRQQEGSVLQPKSDENHISLGMTSRDICREHHTPFSGLRTGHGTQSHKQLGEGKRLCARLN